MKISHRVDLRALKPIRHQVSSSYSLSGLECNLVVLLSVALVDGLKVEGVREEVVYEGAERGPVRPTGGEVFDPDTLRKSLPYQRGGKVEFRRRTKASHLFSSLCGMWIELLGTPSFCEMEPRALANFLFKL